MTRRTILIPSLVLATALLGACGGDDDTSADRGPLDASPTETTSEAAPSDTADAEGMSSAPIVTMEASRFMPTTLEVAPGTEVTFQNDDPFAHTVTSAEGSPVSFDSGELAEGDTFAQTFDEAGTYEYFCEIHPTMRAEVVVS